MKPKGKIPKKQQVYNKFLFDQYLDALRTIEVMQEQIKGLDQRLKLEGAARQEMIAEIKDQREDYHSHIRQLVIENETTHKNFSAELSQVAGDTNKALIAMRQTNDVARECSNKQATELIQLRKAVSLHGQHIIDLEKKKAGRPKKVK